MRTSQVRRMAGYSGVLIVLVAGLLFWLVPRSVTIRVTAEVPPALVQAWTNGAQAAPSLTRVAAKWITAGPCDLQISDRAPLDASWAVLEATIQWPANLGEYRAEMREASTGARAIAATPWIFSPPAAGRYPEKWGPLEKQGLKTAPWAELPANAPWILALDQRKMKHLWISRCSPDGSLSNAALRVASWLYAVDAQNLVIQARYYSPWSKMVDPQGVRPWRELEVIPLDTQLPH